MSSTLGYSAGAALVGVVPLAASGVAGVVPVAGVAGVVAVGVRGLVSGI
jgi:hypothetical protein